jgi:gliding motility-associated-like protein
MADCNGDFGGTAVLDNCSICVGGNTGLTACVPDCNGNFGGAAVLDNCNTCVGGNTGLTACLADCNGDFGGTAVLDNCSTCVGGNTGLTACVADCNGDFGGTAVLDNCNTCVGGNTGLTACMADCNGDFGGTAVLDNCNTCVGGNTGLSACVADCNGDFGGTAVLDNCNTCVGGNTGLTACVADCNGDFGGTAVLDNCNTCVGGSTGLIACMADCNGDFGGTAVLDNCSTCVGGNTGLTACVADCNGVLGGTAFLDNCSTCVGGNTGLTACIQDCIGAWGGSALPGSTCNDGNANTTNDQWGANCVCAGTPTGCTSSAGEDQSVCGLTVTMAASGSGIWAAPVGFQFSDASANNAVVVAPAPGTYSFFWTITNGNCTATDIVSVTFINEPDPSFNYAQSNYCMSAMPPTPWSASPNGSFTATPSGLLLDAVTGEIDPSQSLPGSYLITYDLAGACPSSASQAITIDAPVDASWETPGTVCSSSGPIDLDQLVNGTNGGIWSGPGLNGSTFHPSNSPGTNMISYTVSNGGCVASLEQQIHVQAAPLADAGTDAEVCGSSHVMQANNSMNGIWSGPSAISISPDASAPNANITAAAPGIYVLTWTVTDGACSIGDEVSITFFEEGQPIWVDAGPDQRLALQNSTSLSGSATVGAAVEWSILNGSGYFTFPTMSVTDVEGLAVGLNTFVLSAWMGNCASAHDTVVIMVDDFFIPEGFSPNGDGINDRFEITGIEAFPGSSLQVFDRAGQQIYDHSAYDNSFDGRANNGKPLPDGTYFYILNLGPERSYNGSIILKH